ECNETKDLQHGRKARRFDRACLRRKISGPRAEFRSLRATAESPGDANGTVPNLFSITKTAPRPHGQGGRWFPGNGQLVDAATGLTSWSIMHGIPQMRVRTKRGQVRTRWLRVEPMLQEMTLQDSWLDRCRRGKPFLRPVLVGRQDKRS